MSTEDDEYKCSKNPGGSCRNLTLVKFIAKGTFGLVCKARDNDTGEFLIVKAMRHPDQLHTKTGQFWLQDACRDATFMSLVKNNGCSKCAQLVKGCISTNGGLMIIMEYLGVEDGWIDAQDYATILQTLQGGQHSGR